MSLAGRAGVTEDDSYPIIRMKNVEQRRVWALQACRKAKMRLTPIRERILAFLSASPLPVNIEAVTQAGGLKGACSEATAYRTLMLLKALEVIRQVNLPNRDTFFVLNVPGENSHYLICRCCGQLTELAVGEAVSSLEREIVERQGYTKVHHELQFFGICPKCQKHATDAVCAKLHLHMPRGRLNTLVQNMTRSGGAGPNAAHH